MSRELPQIYPTPAFARPLLGASLALLRDPAAFFASARRRHGDTFAADAFRARVLFVFSPQGVQSLWALPEAEASKGLADYAMLRHKVPDELFAGRRTFPHDLFKRDDVAEYLANLRQGVDEQIAELGDSGTVELFALMRRLGHRVGLASWGGVVGERAGDLDRVVPALDRLDSSESFVKPYRGIWTVLTKKRAEWAALRELDSVFGEIAQARRRRPRSEPDLFDRICAKWEDESSPEREIGIARDVVLVHMGSQSNLFAATAWTMIHLLDSPQLLDRVRAGDEDLLERVAHETIRLRQRSIVLRRVVQSTELRDETTTYRVERGAYVATMMSETNTSAAPGLDRFDPDHYSGARLRLSEGLAAKELVTTFGHGRHSCPAQNFSVQAIRRSISALLGSYEWEPRYVDPRPLRRQIGGVARADRACLVNYRRR